MCPTFNGGGGGGINTRGAQEIPVADKKLVGPEERI